MRYSNDVLVNGNWVDICIESYAETNLMTFYVIKGYEMDKDIYGWGVIDSNGVGYGVWDSIYEAKKIASNLQANKIAEENMGAGIYE